MLFAIKRLTKSDLTFFEYQFRQQNAGNQKSINLNADVFVDVIFPQARTAAGGHARQFPLPLTILGPGLRLPPIRVTRKVIAAGDRQKNWRLNGEFIRDPDDDPERFHGLAAGDFAVFGFEGNGVPTAITMVLISAAEPGDAPLYVALQGEVGTKRMIESSADQLQRLVDLSPENHPIRELLDVELDAALEEAALGSAEGVQQLRRRPSARRMTAEALAAARSRAESVGRDGEIIVDDWLSKEVSAGRLKSAIWIAAENAINPWDFEIVEVTGEKVRVEVKSTGGAFERPLHISQAEIIAAESSKVARTDIYRVYAVSDDGAWLQIARNISDFAKQILAVSATFGAGIVPDGFSIQPRRIAEWSDPIQIRLDPEDED